MGEDVASTSVRKALRAVPGAVNLLGYDSAARPAGPDSKGKAEKQLVRRGVHLAALQERLFAQGTKGDPRRVLLVLQGMDTSGKGGVIEHVVGLVGPAGIKIHSFKKPTPEEAAHHFLWRVRRALPTPGLIGVFDRSHYEDVVVTRVHDWIDDDTRAAHIRDINAFEADLAANGTTIIKCFLHISYTEQRARLLARLDDPTKHWKFNPGDIDERAYWSDYQRWYGAAMSETNTDHAPWYVIPSDSKWYRNWAITHLLIEHLEDLDLEYPKADFDVEICRTRLQPPY